MQICTCFGHEPGGDSPHRASANWAGDTTCPRRIASTASTARSRGSSDDPPSTSTGPNTLTPTAAECRTERTVVNPRHTGSIPAVPIAPYRPPACSDQPSRQEEQHMNTTNVHRLATAVLCATLAVIARGLRDDDDATAAPELRRPTAPSHAPAVATDCRHTTQHPTTSTATDLTPDRSADDDRRQLEAASRRLLQLASSPRRLPPTGPLPASSPSWPVAGRRAIACPPRDDHSPTSSAPLPPMSSPCGAKPTGCSPPPRPPPPPTTSAPP